MGGNQIMEMNRGLNVETGRRWSPGLFDYLIAAIFGIVFIIVILMKVVTK
jgi:hypothetical protein